jgi:hypothetical protein
VCALQILNLTELELNRVDIRVGLSGALYYMDGFSRTVRHLRNLVSQVPYNFFSEGRTSTIFCLPITVSYENMI